MSYSELNGEVTLKMSREDYERILMVFGVASAACVSHDGVKCLLPLDKIIRTLNRLNQGNPNYRPYEVGERS